MSTQSSGATSVAAGAENARQSQRQTLVMAATLWASDAREGAGVPVFIYNISADGIAFRSHHTFVPQTVHYVKLAAGPLRLEGPIRIVWCRRHSAGTFDAGAQFIRA